LCLPGKRQGSGSGSEAVELAASAGLILDDWQAWALCEAMDEQPRGLWSASDVGLEVPRQNGKNSILEARQLAGLFLLGERLQLHTAHEVKTTDEHFLRISQLIEGCPDLDRMVQKIRLGSGEKAIELKDGCRLRFVARSVGSGRGFSGSPIYLDEAFALVATEISALQYAMGAQENPQLWFTSSSSMLTSEVLLQLRKRAEADSGNERLFYALWAAEKEGLRSDRKRWAAANPGYPHRIKPTTIQAELDTAGDNEELLVGFDRERLGLVEETEHVIPFVPAQQWAALGTGAHEMGSGAVLVLDAGPDLECASLCAAQTDVDGIVHIDVVRSGVGTEWVVASCVANSLVSGSPIHVAANSPAAGLVAEIEKGGAEVASLTASEAQAAVVAFKAAIELGTLRHRNDPVLAAAVAAATRKEVGDSWRLSRRSSASDITPLIAAAHAHSLATSAVNVDPLFTIF
jgi:phage terminase large subunit-like protein